MTLIPAGSFLRKRFLNTLLLALTVGLSLNSTAGIFDEGDPEAGQATFDALCATCHALDKNKSAPALGGISDRWGASEELLKLWITDPPAARATGDAYINGMFDKWSPQYGSMLGVPVTDQEIKDIMAYIKNPPVVEATTGNVCLTIEDMPVAEEDGVSPWVLILGLLFIILLLSLSRITWNLRSAIREREGKDRLPDATYLQLAKAWIIKNYLMTALLGFLATSVCFAVLFDGGMSVAVVEGYAPTQPIWFSHAVHVCENDINCEYCHHSARKSKHAGIPTTNVCMNCHKDIQAGSKTGTAEISKIYAAIGFDPETGQYIEGYEQKPVVWNKVHNLPDHVFFSHQQHVVVGGLDCKNCHGPVETFTTGRVSPVELTSSQTDVPGLIQLTKPTLTMGWCIECHNKAEIDDSNGYYAEMHDRMVNSARGQEELEKIMEDNVTTVREMGGWECAKCHY